MFGLLFKRYEKLECHYKIIIGYLLIFFHNLCDWATGGQKYEESHIIEIEYVFIITDAFFKLYVY